MATYTGSGQTSHRRNWAAVGPESVPDQQGVPGLLQSLLCLGELFHRAVTQVGVAKIVDGLPVKLSGPAYRRSTAAWGRYSVTKTKSSGAGRSAGTSGSPALLRHHSAGAAVPWAGGFPAVPPGRAEHPFVRRMHPTALLQWLAGMRGRFRPPPGKIPPGTGPPGEGLPGREADGRTRRRSMPPRPTAEQWQCAVSQRTSFSNAGHFSASP